MIIFPAVDIQGGHAVRLRRGRKEDATIFAENPLDLAAQWRARGANWLHVIDLDGAFSGARKNYEAIGGICRIPGARVQVGGGIRSREDLMAYLRAGASRVIIGTMALEERDLFAGLCREFPGKIGVSLDAEQGRLKSRGWVKDAGASILDIVPFLEKAGAAFIIYTDIERDGMHKGVNLESLERLLAATDLPVIAAGGISTLNDVKNVHKLSGAGNLEGVVAGRALCEGTLDLSAAIKWLAETKTEARCHNA